MRGKWQFSREVLCAKGISPRMMASATPPSRGTPVVTPILHRDRGLGRFDLWRGACLNRREVCFIAHSCATRRIPATTDQRAIHRRRGVPLR